MFIEYRHSLKVVFDNIAQLVSGLVCVTASCATEA